jgi:hypothetical protein
MPLHSSAVSRSKRQSTTRRPRRLGMRREGQCKSSMLPHNLRLHVVVSRPEHVRVAMNRVQLRCLYRKDIPRRPQDHRIDPLLLQLLCHHRLRPIVQLVAKSALLRNTSLPRLCHHYLRPDHRHKAPCLAHACPRAAIRILSLLSQSPRILCKANFRSLVESNTASHQLEICRTMISTTQTNT